MDTLIKAIETHYNGYRFRSRLEARWAVFLDTLGIAYEYEKEGFDLSHLLQPGFEKIGSGMHDEGMPAINDDWRRDMGNEPARYLPDFWIPHLRCWIEIKGQEPSAKEEALADMLAYATKCDVFVFFGDIHIPGQFDDGGTPSNKHFAGSGWDAPYFWCECGACGHLGIEFDGRSDRLDCKRCYRCSWNAEAIGTPREATMQPCQLHGITPDLTGCPRSGGNLDKGYNADSPRLILAYTAARSARFEHGERGR